MPAYRLDQHGDVLLAESPRPRIRYEDRYRLSPAWLLLTHQVVAEQPWCQRCGSQRGLELQHVVAPEHGGPVMDRTNVRVVCRRCA